MDKVAPERWRKIRAIVLDIDGILTDGRIGYGTGSDEDALMLTDRKAN